MTSSLSLIIIRKGTTNQLLAVILFVPSPLSPCNSDRHHIDAPYDVNNSLPSHVRQHWWEIHSANGKGGWILSSSCIPAHIADSHHPPCNLTHSDRSDTRSQPVHPPPPKRTHPDTHPSHAASLPACLASHQRAQLPPPHPVEGRPISKSQGWHLASAAAARFCYSSWFILPPDCFTPMKNSGVP